MELWNLYDENRNKLERIGVRGEAMQNGEFHLVASAWIYNDNKEFLISKRAPNKRKPLKWEATTGSALRGEDTLDAAVREIKEELGIDVKKEDAVLLGTKIRKDKECPDIFDVYIFKNNIPIESVTIQKEEVCDVKWATADEIRKIVADGNFNNPSVLLSEALKFPYNY